MLTAVVHAAGDLRVERRPDPVPQPGEVLLAMTHGGICGSDLHYYREGAVGRAALREPLVLGHEVVGRVAEDPARRLRPGTPVAVHPGTCCGRCQECAQGNRHLCGDTRYLGSAATFPHTQGGFAERLAVPAERLHAVPEELPLSRAVLAEPLAVALHALRRAGGVSGARVLVNGAGPIGALTAGAARIRGAEEVWASDVREDQLRVAERTGADTAVLAGEDALPGEHFDVVVEASGAPGALAAVMASVRRRGVVVQVGSAPGGSVPVPFAPVVAKEIELRGTFRFAGGLGPALAMLAACERFDAVVTRTFPLREAVSAMERAASSAVPGKVVLLLGGEDGGDGGGEDAFGPPAARAAGTHESQSAAGPAPPGRRPPADRAEPPAPQAPGTETPSGTGTTRTTRRASP